MAKWIADAIKKKGALTKTAKSEGGTAKSGKISKDWMDTKLKAKGTSAKTKKRINLAKTLSKFHK